MSRLVTVFGATGAQGGAVVEALLAGGEFKVRGVTRSLGSKKAKDLTLQGVEMVQGSFDEPESLDTAIAGSYGVFLVTNYWEGMDGARETKQGKCAVDACLKAGVKHLIYSGLVRSEKKYGFVVDHLDSKGKVEDYIKEKAGSMIWSSVRVAAYFNNFLTLWKPEKQDDGSYVINVPMEGKPMYGIDVTDVGECVASIFNEPNTYGEKIIGLATEFLTIDQYCEGFNNVLTPKVFKDAKQTAEEMATLGYPGAKELSMMFKLFQLGGIDRDIALTKKLNTKAKSWEEFLVKHTSDFETIL